MCQTERRKKDICPLVYIKVQLDNLTTSISEKPVEAEIEPGRLWQPCAKTLAGTLSPTKHTTYDPFGHARGCMSV